MRVLIKTFISALRQSSYEIFSIREQMPSVKDTEIATFSLNPPKIIITEDKDFGEIVYHKNLKVTGIILLRYLPDEYSAIENKLLRYLAAHLQECIGKFVVINAKLTRTRFLPS